MFGVRTFVWATVTGYLDELIKIIGYKNKKFIFILDKINSFKEETIHIIYYTINL